jgi:hypothetical protein
MCGSTGMRTNLDDEFAGPPAFSPGHYRSAIGPRPDSDSPRKYRGISCKRQMYRTNSGHTRKNADNQHHARRWPERTPDDGRAGLEPAGSRHPPRQCGPGLRLPARRSFIPADDDPWGLVATLRDALAPGSYLVVSHGTTEGRPDTAQAAATVYNRSVTSNLTMRSRAEVLRFFAGFELVDPGLAWVPAWRPDGFPGDFADPAQSWLLAGVGRTPGPAPRRAG